MVFHHMVVLMFGSILITNVTEAYIVKFSPCFSLRTLALSSVSCSAGIYLLTDSFLNADAYNSLTS